MGFAAVGLLIHNPSTDNENCEDEEVFVDEDVDDEEVEYNFLYYTELDEMDEVELDKDTLSELSKHYLRETTPLGDVIMTYNNDAESFWFCTDNKNMSYKTL